MMRSVDDWPLAKHLYQISGGKTSSSIRLSVGVTGGVVLLSRGVCRSVVVVPPGAERIVVADHTLRNSVGAIG